jgi:hypothetical protein
MNTTQQQATTTTRTETRAATPIAQHDIELNNANSDIELVAGAHLVTQRRGYEHHGIYVGNGKVVHYAGFCTSTHRGPVEEVTLTKFAAGHAVAIRPNPNPKYTREEIVLRARSRLGENRYRLLTNNCEHLCAWCLLGESHSEQVHTCLTHPRVGLHALACLCKAMVVSGLKGGYVAAQAA